MIPIQLQAAPQRFPEKKLQGQICLAPYTSIEIDIQGNVRLCECAGWMPTTVGNLFENSIQQILGNELSKSIRRSITAGTYEYCNEVTCGVIGNGRLATLDSLSPQHQDCVRDPDLFVMPHIIRLAGDLSCNLTCPSCRTKLIFPNDIESERQQALGKIIQQNLFSVATDQHIILHVSTSGEIFASPMLLEMVSEIPVQSFPNLDLCIQTNGLLAPKRWHRLGDMQHRVKQITVTTDAARPDTYENLRRGGKWETMQQSLHWISRKKSENGMKLSMRMVVQQTNFREMEEFYQQAKSIGADVVEYSRLTDWGTYAANEFQQHDVFDIEHPEYHEAQQCLDRVKQYPDIFLCGGIS